MEEEHEFTVQDTNNQSLVSKISAVHLGYYADPFAEEFVKFREKKQVIIHRGYWARVYIVRKMVERMIKNSKQKVQIVSLGCGLETMWFNLLLNDETIKERCLFIGLDLPETIHRKINGIQSSDKITKLLTKVGQKLIVSQHKDKLVYGNMYKVGACDLTNLVQLNKVLSEFQVDKKIPTLFYSECVLSYIEAQSVNKLLKFISTNFNLSFVFAYEMLNPQDRYGKMMLKNFSQRGCPLMGMPQYPTLNDQQKRYKQNGFQQTQLYTMRQIYYECIEKEERERIQKIQLLDEFEEWNLIMSHYFTILAANYAEDTLKNKNYEDLIKGMKVK